MFKKIKPKTDLETKADKALKLSEANAKAIQELTDKIQKSFLEYSHVLATLKERNRLR